MTIAGIRWDEGSTSITPCDVASAMPGDEGTVVLSFGQVDAAGSGTVLQPRRLHQVVLSAAAAVALRQMLVRLVADHESDAAAGRG